MDSTRLVIRCLLHYMNVIASMFIYLPEEDATVFAKVQGISILLLHWIMFLQGEVHQLPVHIIALGKDQISTVLHKDGRKRTIRTPFNEHLKHRGQESN